MQGGQNHEAVIERADRAFTLMREHGVYPTPRNFQLYYQHIEGGNPGLSHAIADVVSRGQMTPEAIAAIAAKFMPQDNSAALDTIGEELRQRVETVVATISNAGSKHAAFGETLSLASGQLHRAGEAGNLAAVLDGLVQATRAMEAHTREMESRLEESKTEVEGLRARIKEIRKESLTDALTGLANRKYFDSTIANMAQAAHVAGERFCLVMADIDHFKKFNDTYGHQTGDSVLRLVARSIMDNVKGRDLAARFGGEEFAILLASARLANAHVVAEQIRRNVETKKVVKRSTGESLGTVTLSLGCAEYLPGETVESLIGRADQALYAAKRGGRNRVAAASTDSDYELPQPRRAAGA